MTRVAVLGLYRSGSTAVAGVLDRLGVTMGPPEHYEPVDLSQHLRVWWNEPRARSRVQRLTTLARAPSLPWSRSPQLKAMTPASERIVVLADWIEAMERRSRGPVGAKHPLLCLSGDDLLQAWGESTRFVWSYRELHRSIGSLVGKRWFPGKEEAMQRSLWDAVTTFFDRQDHLRLEFAAMMTSPHRQIGHLIDYLDLDPRPDQVAAANGFIQPQALE